MPKDPTGPATDWNLLTRAVAALLRAAVRIFFREIEIVGAEKIPRGVPLVVVANHVNGIVDPLLVGLLRLRVRFLAKSTLWSHPVIHPLLQLTRAIPVFRHQDAGVDTTRNGESFERCHAALAAGEVIALFPEGKSHSDAGLAPLKTGAARIVLEAEAKHPGLGIRVIPVGLSFDAKAAFRSRAVVRVGDPLDPSPERRACAADGRAAVRQLTDRIAAALTAVTVNYPSWEEGRLIERAADVYAESALELPAPAPLAERCAVRGELARAYSRLAPHVPVQVVELGRAVARYDTLLRALGLRDGHVVARYPRRLVGRFLLRRVGSLLVGLPLALLGTVIHWLPYRVIGILVRRRVHDEDVAASYKLLGGALMLPLWWVLCAALVGYGLGVGAGLLTLPAAICCGYVALRFHERRAELWQEARAYWLLRSHRRLAAELTRRRAAVATALRAVVAAHSWPAMPA